jgi:hypothetical protein
MEKSVQRPVYDLPFARHNKKIRSLLRNLDFIAFAVAFHPSSRVYSLRAVWTTSKSETVCSSLKRSTGAPNQLTSPKSWNRDFSPRKTPPVVGPEFKPEDVAIKSQSCIVNERESSPRYLKRTNAQRQISRALVTIYTNAWLASWSFCVDRNNTCHCTGTTSRTQRLLQFGDNFDHSVSNISGKSCHDHGV